MPISDPEKRLAYSRQYYENNKERLNQRSKQLYQNKKEEIKARVRRYQDANLEKLQERRRNYYISNKVRIISNTKLNYEANKMNHNLRVRKRTVERRIFIDQLKTESPCMDCGNFFPAVCMDFDHVRGNKVAPVSKMLSLKLSKLQDELAKCELVCSNCHRLRTVKRLREQAA